MMTGADRREWVNCKAEDLDEALILFDGLDEAIVGIAEVHTLPSRVVYSYNEIIGILLRDMSWEQAIEYFEFNIACLWAGENTPAILYEPHEPDYEDLT